MDGPEARASRANKENEMKDLLKRFESAMSAAAFAEGGEPGIAKAIWAGETGGAHKKTISTRTDGLMCGTPKSVSV